MIQIEMSHHDMAHVVGFESQRRHLRESRLGRVETRRGDGDEGRTQAFGIGDIAGAQTGIDQNQTVFGFDQQHMANETPAIEQAAGAVQQPCPDRTQRRRDEMMNPHLPCPRHSVPRL